MDLQSRNRRYVLVSACRNEAAFIDGLIDAVASQTIRPDVWVIVDDGSTDDTYARASRRSDEMPFIHVLQMPTEKGPRSFASQVFAAQCGYEYLRQRQFEFVGFLDADIRFGPNYYEHLLNCFQADAELGLCGGAVFDKHSDGLDYLRGGSEHFHVPGGVQFFRRECFDVIGGYVPIEGGGQDTVADTMAMMNGWKIRVFRDLTVLHLRPEGALTRNVFSRGLECGRKYYLLGYHPLFYAFHLARRVHRDPVLTTCALIGFVIATLARTHRPVTEEYVRFQRGVQLGRLGAMVRSPRHFGSG